MEAADIRSNGGLLNRVNGREDITSFYCYWGDKQHWLMVSVLFLTPLACNIPLSAVMKVEDFRPRHSGIYAVQALYSNGAGTRSTGIACCLKWLLIYCLSGSRILLLVVCSLVFVCLLGLSLMYCGQSIQVVFTRWKRST